MICPSDNDAMAFGSRSAGAPAPRDGLDLQAPDPLVGHAVEVEPGQLGQLRRIGRRARAGRSPSSLSTRAARCPCTAPPRDVLQLPDRLARYLDRGGDVLLLDRQLGRRHRVDLDPSRPFQERPRHLRRRRRIPRRERAADHHRQQYSSLYGAIRRLVRDRPNLLLREQDRPDRLRVAHRVNLAVVDARPSTSGASHPLDVLGRVHAGRLQDPAG